MSTRRLFKSLFVFWNSFEYQFAAFRGTDIDFILSLFEDHLEHGVTIKFQVNNTPI